MFLGGGTIKIIKTKNLQGSNKKSSAFTLAETLITIAIIGVVAALTIAPLSHKMKKHKLQKQLLQTYAELQETYRLILNSEETITLGEGGNKTNYNYPIKNAQVFQKFIKGFYALDKTTNWSGITNRMNKVYKGKGLYSHNGKSMPVSPHCDTGGIWMDIKGRIWLFNDDNAEICVDINGVAPPNRLGWDFFIFYPTEDNIYPQYSNKISEYLRREDYTYYAIINQSPKDKTQDYWNDYLK